MKLLFGAFIKVELKANFEDSRALLGKMMKCLRKTKKFLVKSNFNSMMEIS
jgi:hypothetical protein